MIVLGFSGIQNGGYYRDKFGLRFVGHDAAVAVVADGRLVFAAEEERFNREKHTSRFPVGALRAALGFTGLSLSDIDVAAGLPVVASEACGLEAVPGVRIVPTGDAAALSRALRVLCNETLA